MITQEHLDEWFMSHELTKEQQVTCRQIRTRGRQLAETILELTPACADQTAAIRKVREAVMTANAAVACVDLYNRVTVTTTPA